MVRVVVGGRFRCSACGAEGVITRVGRAELTCCGEPVEVTFTPPDAPRAKLSRGGAER
jgi:hypothetical protein